MDTACSLGWTCASLLQRTWFWAPNSLLPSRTEVWRAAPQKMVCLFGVTHRYCSSLKRAPLHQSHCPKSSLSLNSPACPTAYLPSLILPLASCTNMARKGSCLMALRLITQRWGVAGSGHSARFHGDWQNKCQHRARRPARKSRVFTGAGESLHLQYLHSLGASSAPLCSIESDLKKKRKLLALVKTADPQYSCRSGEGDFANC